mgnify:CR=1 FL=1
MDGDGRADWLSTDNTDAGIARHGYALICGDDQCTSVSRERASVPSVVRSPLGELAQRRSVSRGSDRIVRIARWEFAIYGH